MTEITKDHAEWAVVDRLRAMLVEPPHAQYNVTQSYALCVAIFAWVMQRVRTPIGQAQSIEDFAAIKAKRALDEQSAEVLPWGLETDASAGKSALHSDFKGFTAFNFLKWLRDACCHGDARQITPVNKDARLIGFEFRATAKGDRERMLVLTERDLRRIGGGLASLYCEALQSAHSPMPSHFAEDARSMREIRKAV